MIRHPVAMGALVVTFTLCVASTAHAQTPDIDMEAVKQAYWRISGADPAAGLQWFEQEVNKVYNGEGYVSVAASREDVDGSPRVVVRGYVDKDGAPGFNQGSDQQVFAFVQQGALAGNSVNYEYLDAWNNVYYRGSRVLPSSPFYTSYYVNWRTPIAAYYTPTARLAYLRSWRVGFRTSPAYVSWRGRFVTWRSGYAQRVVRLRTTYGVPRARVVVRASVRPAVRVSVRSAGSARVVAPVRRVVPVRATVKVKVRTR